MEWLGVLAALLMWVSYDGVKRHRESIRKYSTVVAELSRALRATAEERDALVLRAQGLSEQTQDEVERVIEERDRWGAERDEALSRLEAEKTSRLEARSELNNLHTQACAIVKERDEARQTVDDMNERTIPEWRRSLRLSTERADACRELLDQIAKLAALPNGEPVRLELRAAGEPPPVAPGCSPMIRDCPPVWVDGRPLEGVVRVDFRRKHAELGRVIIELVASHVTMTVDEPDAT